MLRFDEKSISTILSLCFDIFFLSLCQQLKLVYALKDDRDRAFLSWTLLHSEYFGRAIIDPAHIPTITPRYFVPYCPYLLFCLVVQILVIHIPKKGRSS